MVNAAEMLPPGDRLPADHPMPLEGPVTEPGAWYGPDLAARDAIV